jgi:Tol biopolymer transport system component
MNLALPRRVLAAAIVFAMLIGGCGVNVSQTPDPSRPQPTQQPAVPPTPDKIEKAQFRVTLDGRVLVVKDGNIWLLTQDAFKQISTGGKSRQPVWSPDGRLVAFVKNNGSSSDLWVMNADGSSAHTITQNVGSGGKSSNWAFQPVWSADGKLLAYVSEETTYDLALWVINPDGSGRRLLAALDAFTGGIDTPTWSPDGTRIAFTAYRNGLPQIWSLSLKTSAWVQLSKSAGGAYDAAWSPDGAHLAYVGRENGKNDIWVIDEDGANPVRITTNGWSRSPAWSPDGSRLGYLDGTGGSFDFWMVKITSQNNGLRLDQAEQVTKNAQLDPASGLSWAR